MGGSNPGRSTALDYVGHETLPAGGMAPALRGVTIHSVPRPNARRSGAMARMAGPDFAKLEEPIAGLRTASHLTYVAGKPTRLLSRSTARRSLLVAHVGREWLICGSTPG